MQNLKPEERVSPADTELDGTVKVEEDEVDVKPDLDLMPTFERHYVYLQEPALDVDNSESTSVQVKQESDPFTASPSVTGVSVDQEGSASTLVVPRNGTNCWNRVSLTAVNHQPKTSSTVWKEVNLNQYNYSYKCTSCMKVFPKRELRLRHTTTNHADQPCRNACRFCKQAFKYSWFLKIHLGHRREYRCDCCEISFKTRSRLTRHLKKMSRLNKSSLTCGICRIVFTCKDSLAKHVPKHRNCPNRCFFRIRDATERSLLRAHFKLHSNCVQVPCVKCNDNTFFLRYETDKFSERARIVECQECGEIFGSCSDMVEHDKRKHGSNISASKCSGSRH